MKHFNIEIKAKSSNHEFIRNTLIQQWADFKWIDHQIDTYYKVEKWRLKLREWNIENYLIHYIRSDIEWPKNSDVTLYQFEPSSSLKKVLNDSHDILTVVDKTREIYFIDNIKFHIDIVKALWTFVEIEAIDNDWSIWKKRLLEQCSIFMEILKVHKKDLVSSSYSDLLIDSNL